MIWKNKLLNSCGIKIDVKNIRGFSRSVPACAVNFGALRGCVEMNFAPLEGVASNVVRARGRLSPPLLALYNANVKLYILYCKFPFQSLEDSFHYF